ncbi:MAG: ATP synthase F1 subunit delta [Planctomycetes bacterium]|nr:ATP synthase F1 subunit delta [Planctomycetota bacterium]
MAVATVPSVYATALLELAADRSKTPAVVEDCMGVLAALESNPDLVRQIDSPKLSRVQAKELIANCFAAHVEEEILTFLHLLIDRDRFSEACEILSTAVEMADKQAGIVNVSVVSAQPLDDIMAKQINRSLASIFGEGIVLHTSVEPDMLGGLQVRVGDYLIDGSVRRHLNEMKKRILDAPIQADLWEE